MLTTAVIDRYLSTVQPTNIAQVYSILPNLVTHNFEENYGFTTNEPVGV